MIETYFVDIRQLDKEEIFQQQLRKLSAFRQTKTAVLRHEMDKKRSVGAGIALDAALRGYGLREREMEYHMGSNGKPYLKYHPELFFSLSHSGDYAICSIGEREMGNDIELVKSGRSKVAERFFTGEEQEWIARAETEAEAKQRLFRIWTIKESFLKTTGCGMSLPLSDFSVEMEAEHGRIRIHQRVEAKYFHVKEYCDIKGYCVSLCCKECRELGERMIPVRIQTGVRG